jgi:hypothetical protein
MRGINHFGAEPSASTAVVTTERMRRTLFAQWPEDLEGAEHGDVVYVVSRQDWRRLAGGLPAELT